MSYHQGAEGGAIHKERQKDGSPNKDFDETMDPHMSVHVRKTDFPTLSCESNRTLESDGDLSSNLKHLQLRTTSHMSMSGQSVNSSIDPSDDGDQSMDKRNNLKHLQLRTDSHMSMSYQSVNSSIDPTDGGDQIMDERVHLQRPVSPAPSYVSMKSDKSMNVPLGFKEGELTQQEGVLLERAESPALSYASAKSHQSLNTDEEDEEVNSAQKEKNNLKHLQLRTDSHKSMSDQSVNSSIDPTDGGDQTKDESIIRPGEVVCDVCDKVRAVKFCQTCTQSYCETHVRKHYTLPKLQRHTLVEVTGDLEERLCQHDYSPLEVFCRTDQKMICSLCAVTEHKGHDVVYEEIKQAGRQTQGEEQHQNQVFNEVLPAPDQLTVDSVDTTSAAVSWSQPPGLDQTQHHYQISYRCPGTEPHITTTSSHSITLSDLKPATEYSVTVCTVLENGKQSQLVLTTLTTTMRITVAQRSKALHLSA